MRSRSDRVRREQGPLSNAAREQSRKQTTVHSRRGDDSGFVQSSARLKPAGPSSFVRGQQQNQQADQKNCAGRGKRANDEYSCQRAKIARRSRWSTYNVVSSDHSKQVADTCANQNHQRINENRYSVLGPRLAMQPIEKNCTDACENRRQEGEIPEKKHHRIFCRVSAGAVVNTAGSPGHPCKAVTGLPKIRKQNESESSQPGSRRQKRARTDPLTKSIQACPISRREAAAEAANRRPAHNTLAIPARFLLWCTTRRPVRTVLQSRRASF
jgi:hypothetical protein